MTVATAKESRPRIILCADDYGLSAGVSDGIRDLAGQQRLSATSAIVTLERWPQDARQLRDLRDRLAVGLHVNLTLGEPLGPMRSLAADGHLPSLRALVALSLSGRIDRDEVAAEVTRQLQRFESEFGFPPDHIDGHQHAHALPGVRVGVLAALAARFPEGGPLVRDPADSLSNIWTHSSAPSKAFFISLLSNGFGRAARARGFPVNASFSGVSSFDRNMPYLAELDRALRAASPRHLVMCHPGHVDPALAQLDPVVARRQDEYEAIAHHAALPSLLWRPARAKDGQPINWEQD